MQVYTDQQHGLSGGNTKKHLYESMEDFLGECFEGVSKKFEMKQKEHEKTQKQEPVEWDTSQPIILSKRTFHAKSTNQPFFILKIINKKSLLIGYHMIYKKIKIPQTVLTVARQHDIYTGAKESENYWMHSMRADLNQARFFSTYIIFLGRKNKKASDQVSVVMRLDSVYTCILHQYLDIVNGSVKDSKEDNVCVLSYL